MAVILLKKMQLDLSGLARSTPQHDKQITVIRLHLSGTFARILILCKPLAFIGRTLKKQVKILLNTALS